ncbi:MAG: hypothetical protein ACEQSR_07350 [Candidatus Methylacidiphilales bacterium]
MKKNLIIIIVLLLSNQVFAQFGQHFSELNKYKICVGVGTGIYWGHARLYTLPKTNNPDERTFAFSASFFKTFSDRIELGARYTHTDLIGTKSGKSWGSTTLFNTTLDEVALQANISLNRNLFLREEFYTINLILGAGATYFEAELKDYASGNIKSSVGKGINENGHIANKQLAGFGTIGLGFHVRLGQLVSVGIDNYLNITSTKNLTGLTITESVNQFDSYSVHLLTIGLRLGKGNKLFCPRI